MKYMEAGIEDCERIYALVQETIKTVYPKYYPREVVVFLKICTVWMVSDKI